MGKGVNAVPLFQKYNTASQFWVKAEKICALLSILLRRDTFSSPFMMPQRRDNAVYVRWLIAFLIGIDLQVMWYVWKKLLRC